MSRPVYRALETSDLDDVARLEREILSPAWSRASLESFLAARRLAGLAPGAWIDGALVGVALSAWTGERVDLYRLAVRTSVRRRGLARSLVKRVVEGARELGARGLDLELRADNTDARAFYAKFGFREVGRRVGYYRGAGETGDAVLMSLELDDFPREPGATSR